MNWRPHTEQPPAAARITAILAIIGDDGEPYLACGVYSWEQGVWRHEEDYRRPPARQYWWLPEDDLLKTLP